MDILKEYKDFDEKKTFANIIKIDTKEQFDELFDKLKLGTGSYWRGVNESKHMTYSSAQRMWIRENLSHENSVFEYIKHIYNYVSIWHGSCFSKVLNKGLSIPSGLSILQHYGCPTPLIDVTKNPLVGLFFASYYTNSFFSKNSLGVIFLYMK